MMTLPRRIIQPAAALAAAVLLASACSGDDQPQPQPAAAQQQASQPAAQQAVVQAQQAGQAQQQAQTSPPQSAAQAQSARQQARPALEPTVQNFANIVDDWLDSLTSLRTINSAAVDNRVSDAVLKAEFSFTRDAVHIATDELPLLGGETAFPPLQVLWTDGGIWASPAPLAGWAPLDAVFPALAEPEDAGLVRLSGLQNRVAVYPSTASVMEASLDGRPVWALSYEMSGSQLAPLFAGSPEMAADPYAAMNPLGVNLAGVLAAVLGSLEVSNPQIERLATRMIADPATGALLSVEMTADLPEGTETLITRLASWNERLEIPEPLPSASRGEFLAAFYESAATLVKVEGGNAYELLENARVAVEQAEAVYVVQEISGTVNGEERTARSEIKHDRAGGRFEVATEVDGEETFRLLWTRDGLWITDNAGRWQPTWPTEIGLGDYAGVDEYLADAVPAGDDSVLFARATLQRVLAGPDRDAIDISAQTTYDDRAAAAELVAELLIDEGGPLISLDAVIEDVLALALSARVAADETTPISRTVEARFTAAGIEYDILSVTTFRDPAGISFSTPG